MPDDTTATIEAAPAAETTPDIAPVQAETTAGGEFDAETALSGVDIANWTPAMFETFEKGHVAAPVQPDVQPEDEDASGADEVPEAEGVPAAEIDANSPKHMSLKALKPEDRLKTLAAMDLIRGGKSPAEAFAEVFGIAALPAAVAETVEQATEQAPVEQAPAPPQIKDLEDHLAWLQTKYREAKESYDPAATDILEQMTDAKISLNEAKRDAKQAAAAQAVIDQKWLKDQEESLARAERDYAHLDLSEGSAFRIHFDDEVLLAEVKSDPILKRASWAEEISQRVEGKFFKGVAAKSSAPVTSKPNQIPPVPARQVRLPGSPVGPGFAAGSLSPQTALAEIDKLTPEQQDAFVQALDRFTSR